MIPVAVPNLVFMSVFSAIGFGVTFFWLLVKGCDFVFNLYNEWVERRQEKKRGAEAELDRQQAELRATILRLAEVLGVEALESRKALIRESFLTSGALPELDR